MVKELSKIHPIFRFNRSHLYLWCDKRGVILKIFEAQSLNASYFVRQLNEKPNLNSFFDLIPFDKLSKKPDNFSVFPSKADYTIHERFESFYTCLPAMILRITPLEKNKFMGIVIFSDIVQHTYSEKSSSMLYIGRDQTLQGFNHTFFSFFSNRFSTPKDMLNKKASEFLTPTPEEVQREAVVPFEPEKKSGFKRLYDFGFNFPFGKAGLSMSPSGLIWENQTGGLCSLGLPQPVNTLSLDILVEAELESLKGDDPVFILADRFLGKNPPDVYGYLLGSLGTQKITALKKNGFLSAFQEPYPSGQKRKCRLQFACIGATLFLFYNGTRLLAFQDSHFAGHPAAALALGLRTGSACRLKRLTVFTAPKDQAALKNAARSAMVKLKTKGKHYFLLNPFYTFDLTTKFPGLMGYTLQDVTPLQTKVQTLTKKYESLLENIKEKGEPLIGKSPAFLEVKNKAAIAASSRATVLVEGPTGTGKEMFARFIHAYSTQASGPFIKVDCSSLPQSLMESELFGYEKGAFTGAEKRKIGLFEAAEGGSIFLDEVENIIPSAQAKLLRFLQDFSIVRIGGQKPRILNVRLIAASNSDLRERVKSGSFREDLFYRLAVVNLQIPSLAKRKEDIPELCGKFLEEFNKTSAKKVSGLSPNAFKKLYNYHWPGNIRELRNILQQAVIFSEGSEISEEILDLPPTASYGKEKPSSKFLSRGSQPYHLLSKMSVNDFKAIVSEEKGNIHRVAKGLGVTRQAIYKHFKKAGLSLSNFRR